jgi:cellulose synthase/poly-beta-1,6-N-acetylglucosamine synthase-like glycosyltransferase
MYDLLLTALISLFAVYGLFHLIYLLFRFFRRDNIKKYIILEAKNQENNIEAVLRSLMRENPATEIIVIDQGSLDDTMAIVQTLSEDYPYISISENRAWKDGLNC